MRALHIPTSPHRLLSTHALCSQHEKSTIEFTALGAKVSISPASIPILAPVNMKSNLIVSMGYSYVTFPEISINSAAPFVVSDANINLPEDSKELLRWHQRLGHEQSAISSSIRSIGEI